MEEDIGEAEQKINNFHMQATMGIGYRRMTSEVFVEDKGAIPNVVSYLQ